MLNTEKSVLQQNNYLNSPDCLLLLEELKLVRDNLEELRKAVLKDKKKEKLLGEWITEKEVMEITGLCRSSLFQLFKDGKITKSKIGNKCNYYKLSDFKSLLDENEKLQ